jgi:hypothetical protein
MFGYFANNKYENFATSITAPNDDSRIQRLFDAESKALTQINSTGETAAAEIKKKSDDAVSQVNKSTNDATQQIIGKINEKYNEVEQKIPLLTKDAIDKTVKQAVDDAIKKAEPAAKKMVYDVTGAYNYGKTNYNQTEGYANISKDISKTYEKISANISKDYKKISTNKTTSSLIFIFFIAFVILSVFGIYKFKYDQSHISELIKEFESTEPTSSSSKLSSIGKGLFRIAIICGTIMLCIIIFKAGILKINITSSEALDILTTVATIAVPIIGITMITIENLPLMMRSFENTIGYFFIKGSELSECTRELFNQTGNYNDYSIVTTQLFEENFTYYLTCMNKNFKADGETINLNRFKNTFLNDSYFTNNKLDMTKLKDPKGSLHKLLEFVVKKRFISNMSWIAFSSIYALYICSLALL